jgi:hypothetical protein
MWVDSVNFDIFAAHRKGQVSLEKFGIESEPTEYKVAFNDLTSEQKKQLVDIDVDFKLYVQSGKVNPALKSKVIKEELYPKEDIVTLVKNIITSNNRNAVMEMIVGSSIPPVVIQQWLFQGALKGTKEAWDTVVLMETYTDNVEAYACLAAGEELLGAKFSFPTKLRE